LHALRESPKLREKRAKTSSRKDISSGKTSLKMEEASSTKKAWGEFESKQTAVPDAKKMTGNGLR